MDAGYRRVVPREVVATDFRPATGRIPICPGPDFQNLVLINATLFPEMTMTDHYDVDRRLSFIQMDQQARDYAPKETPK